MTKTILLPTDFSSNADMACQFACKIAQQRAFHIHLVHCYTVESVAGVKGVEETEESILWADQQIASSKAKMLEQFPGLNIQTSCFRGLIIDKLLELSSSQQYDLMVLGASGAGAKPLYWGSTTVALAEKSAIPVIVVPPHEFSFSLQEVLLLSNFKTAELHTLTKCAELLGDIEQLDILHVFEQQRQRSVRSSLESWAFNIKELGSIGSVKTFAKSVHPENQELDSIPEVVGKTIEEITPNLILVTPSKKSFFQRLFSLSVSKAIALELTRPAFFDRV